MTLKIYARTTELVEVPIDEALSFFDANHRSGALKLTPGLFAVGLMTEKRLVAVALFGAPRTTHGETKHIGSRCAQCIVDTSKPELKECLTHGFTKHKGDSCYKCTVAKQVTLKECSIHGMSKHRGATCYKCTRAKSSK